jgi:hypothetical protein
VGANQQENGITRIEKAGSERELLSLFLSKLQKLDPDIIIGEFERGPTGTSRFFDVGNSVADPDPPDPHVFGPPGSGSISQRYGSGSGSGSFYHQAKKIKKTLIPTALRLLFDFLSLKMIYMFLQSGSIPPSEVWIRIRLRIRIWILLSPSKKSKKNLDSYCFATSF